MQLNCKQVTKPTLIRSTHTGLCFRSEKRKEGGSAQSFHFCRGEAPVAARPASWLRMTDGGSKCSRVKSALSAAQCRREHRWLPLNTSTTMRGLGFCFCKLDASLFLQPSKGFHELPKFPIPFWLHYLECIQLFATKTTNLKRNEEALCVLTWKEHQVKLLKRKKQGAQ